jgi:hypothetical protein
MERISIFGTTFRCSARRIGFHPFDWDSGELAWNEQYQILWRTKNVMGIALFHKTGKTTHLWLVGLKDNKWLNHRFLKLDEEILMLLDLIGTYLGLPKAILKKAHYLQVGLIT